MMAEINIVSNISGTVAYLSSESGMSENDSPCRLEPEVENSTESGFLVCANNLVVRPNLANDDVQVIHEESVISTGSPHSPYSCKSLGQNYHAYYSPSDGNLSDAQFSNDENELFT